MLPFVCAKLSRAVPPTEYQKRAFRSQYSMHKAHAIEVRAAQDPLRYGGFNSQESRVGGQGTLGTPRSVKFSPS